MTARSVFLYWASRRGNGVERERERRCPFFFLPVPRAPREDATPRGGIPARGDGGFVYLRPEKRPAGQINDLASIPMSGVARLAFLPSGRHLDQPPSIFPFASQCPSQTGIPFFFFFSPQRFFRPEGRARHPGRGRTSSSSGKPFRRTDRNGDKKEDRAGSRDFAARHRDLRGIHSKDSR